MHRTNQHYFENKYKKLFKQQNVAYSPFNIFGINYDGWNVIIEVMCKNIQDHINYSRKCRAVAIRYNRALQRFVKYDDIRGLLHFYTHNGKVMEEQVNRDTEKLKYREVPDACTQVEFICLKEKFGGLRVYYKGGNEFTDGLISMSEAISKCTCERCGNNSVAQVNDIGWINTICSVCKKELLR